MAATDCVVYLGPSLSRREAVAILPDALYLPPACCLDILLALRLEPRVIVLIDGVYETVGSVWHKELLLALESGIKVLGGGSMGALRSAELAPFGMEGVGAIYVDYLTGVCTDDDDVAVLQTPDGVAVTDAIVNIRATVRHACHVGVLTRALADRILSAAKGRFYQELTLNSLVADLATQAPAADAAALQRFTAWCRQGGFVDQKAIDAGDTLRRARAVLASPRRPTTSTPAPRTIFVRKLEQLAATSPFGTYQPALPYDEKVALAARYVGVAYAETKRLAVFLQAVHGIASGVPPLINDDRGWVDAIESAHAPWLESLDAVGEYAAHLLRVDDAYAPLRRAGTDPIPWLENSDPDRHDRLMLSARLWRIIEANAGRQGLRLTHDQLQDRAELFRQQHRLTTNATVADWLRTNALSFSRFQDLLTSWALFEHVGHLQPPPTPGAVASRPRWWLREAIVAARIYAGAEEILSSARRGGPVPLPKTDEEAFRCDFQSGRWGAEGDLRAMATDGGSSDNTDITPRNEART